jgi:AraC-like DNA-binding protein
MQTSLNPVLFPTTYTRTLAREQGLDQKGQQALLKGTKLSPEDLLQLGTEIDAVTQGIIVRNALALSQNPALGLKWGANLHLAAHGPLGTLIASSPSLGHAWKATRKYHDIRGGFVSMDGQMDGEHFAVVLQVHAEMDEFGRFFTEAVLATMVNHLGMIIGRASPAVRVELAYPAPPYAGVYPDYLNAPCVFDQPETRIIIPAGLSALPNPMADQETYQLALVRCEELLLAQQQPKGWTSRVLDLLRRNPGQIWTGEQVAQHFHLSSRTLMRYLSDEGTTYQTLRDSELGRQAKQSLENPNNTVESVAHSLGYQEASNFRRAFKRWFGITPQNYMESHRRT